MKIIGLDFDMIELERVNDKGKLCSNSDKEGKIIMINVVINNAVDAT